MKSDIELARLFLDRVHNAKERGIAFTLSFQAFKNLTKSKKCKYTGMTLIPVFPGKPPSSNTWTIDRIDANKGYESGNVVAVAWCVNQWKGYFENPNAKLTVQMAQKVLNIVKKFPKPTPRKPLPIKPVAAERTPLPITPNHNPS